MDGGGVQHDDMVPLADADRAVHEHGMDKVQVHTITGTPSVGPVTKGA